MCFLEFDQAKKHVKVRFADGEKNFVFPDAFMKGHLVITPTTEETAEEESFEIEKDNIINLIEGKGIEYVDMRPKNGALWIIGGMELKGFVDFCNKDGYEFAFVPTGSKATERRPGWWLKKGGK